MRQRATESVEGRLRALEFQRMNDRMEVVKLHDRVIYLEQQFEEQTKIGMEMRRDLYGTRTATEARFAATEIAIERQLARLAAHQDEVKRYLQSPAGQGPTSCGRTGREEHLRQSRRPARGAQAQL